VNQPHISVRQPRLGSQSYQEHGKNMTLEQNPDTKSRWAVMARNGKKVMQFLEARKYVAVVVDGKAHIYPHKR